MHFYLVDDFVTDRRYEAVLNRIESRLTEIGIHGRIERLTILKNLGELVDEAVRRGAETVVAVGDDRTVSKMVSALAHHSVPFGFIPVGPSQTIAKSLGIPVGEAACDVLSRRVIEEVDLGKVGDRYFLMSVEAPEAQYSLKCDGTYTVSLTAAEPLSIRNLGSASSASNPKDGILEAVIGQPKRGVFSGFFRRETESASIFPFRRLTITSDAPLSLLLDGQTVVKAPATVEATPKRLKVIVGKDRTF